MLLYALISAVSLLGGLPVCLLWSFRWIKAQFVFFELPYTYTHTHTQIYIYIRASIHLHQSELYLLFRLLPECEDC